MKYSKEKWIEALRSGGYKQGRGRLHIPSDNSYCCIGVFCHINGIPIDKNGFSTKLGENIDSYDVLRNIIGDKEVVKLYRMNDSQHKTFLEIADHIEQYLNF